MDPRQKSTWNQEQVDQLFGHLSRGIKPARPGELVLLALFFMLALAALVFLDRYRRRQRRLALEELARQSYANLTEGRFNASQIALLENLALCTDDPPLQKAELLRNPRVFYLALKTYLGTAIVSADTVAATIGSLGFPGRQDGLEIFSTADLPAGTAFYNAQGQITFRLHSQADGFYCLDRAENPGGQTAYLHRSEGLYELPLLPLGEGRYQHTFVKRKEQRRRSARLPVQLPAFFGDATARIENLGGGGARLRLSRFPGEGILNFQLGKRTFELESRVVAESPWGVHLEFTNIRPSEQDAIYRHLFASKI